MAIAYDNKTSGGVAQTASSLTVSHVVSGSNTLLLVLVEWYNSTSVTISGVTYAGTSMTQLRTDTVTVTGSTTLTTAIYYLVAPTSGTNNIVASFSSLVSAQLAGLSLTGVDQSSPIDAHNGTTGSTSSLSISVTSVADNAWGASIGGDQPGRTLTTGSSQTEIFNGSSGNSVAAAGYKGPFSPAGSQTFSYSANASGVWAISAVTIAPAAVTNLSLSVFDSSTVSESTTLLEIHKISTSDSSSVTESTSIVLVIPNISIFDSSTVTENVAILERHNINTNDSSTVTDIPIAIYYPPQIFDSSTVTENTIVTIATIVPVDETSQANWIIGLKIWS